MVPDAFVDWDCSPWARAEKNILGKQGAVICDGKSDLDTAAVV